MEEIKIKREERGRPGMEIGYNVVHYCGDVNVTPYSPMTLHVLFNKGELALKLAKTAKYSIDSQLPYDSRNINPSTFISHQK
jgi:hypothetical protein